MSRRRFRSHARIAFTGTLECMPRREAFQATVGAGAMPAGSVSKRTDYLVVGTTDLRKVGESGRSTKHRKALTQQSGREVDAVDSHGARVR